MSEYDGSPMDPDIELFNALGVKYARSFEQLPHGIAWELAEDDITIVTLLAEPEQEGETNAFNRLVHSYGRAFYIVRSEPSSKAVLPERTYTAYGDAREREIRYRARDESLEHELDAYNQEVLASYRDFYSFLPNGTVIDDVQHVPQGFTLLQSGVDRDTILVVVQISLRPNEPWYVMPQKDELGAFDASIASIWVEDREDTRPIPITRMTPTYRWLTLIAGEKTD